jgi:hypothetical protein
MQNPQQSDGAGNWLTERDGFFFVIAMEPEHRNIVLHLQE